MGERPLHRPHLRPSVLPPRRPHRQPRDDARSELEVILDEPCNAAGRGASPRAGRPRLAGRLHPDSLGLEITEGLLLEETPATALTIEVLQALSVRLLLDDFGTGYSSLRYLQRYPLDGLKVDRAFVMGVIPEGVETESQLERLKAIGCDHAQGFLLSRPLPAEGIEDLLIS